MGSDGLKTFVSLKLIVWLLFQIADTEHLVCDAVIGMRTRAILEGDADSNFRRRIARLNRAMPKIGSRRELLSALFKCTKLDDVMLGSRLTDAIREAPQWTSLYDSYQTQRTRLLKWVTETNEDECVVYGVVWNFFFWVSLGSTIADGRP